MSCDASIGGYDGEPVSCFSTRWRTARIQRTCFECRDPIKAGETYECVSWLFEGSWERYSLCKGCSEVQVEFSDGGRCIGTTWDDMRQNWYDGSNLQACMNRVASVAAKAKLRDQWLKWKGLT